ncbi:G/T mismatch-specific thymine DNA glycosylase [Dufourea novaeangliae]|uniref:G/T mismatch-specific thymine DNA glycosylase n=1 Tax=Dufourea novaeangliae TaxID=178035 RepID=A0A154PPR9_DUFNO|nr:G/T mismatch-specific thymine DNA glycosylase [Dufourea novaeangliae]
MSTLALDKLKKRAPVKKKESKKKIDRFDGLSEEEVQRYTLPDYLEMNLDMVFVGINPSLMAAHRGRYYAGPEDYKLPRYGIGLTNIVERPTRSSADLKRTEIKEGCEIVKEKLKTYKPKIAVFNGKCIYDVFAKKTNNFNFGLQPERIEDVALWVTPSSSARCANFPKMTDKLHFFTALKKYLQFLKGEIEEIDIKEFLFEGKCKQFIPRTSKMWRRRDVSAFLHGGRIANKNTVCLDTSDENVAVVHSTEFIVKRLEEDERNEIKGTPDTDETESLKNSEAIITQGPVKLFFENDVSFPKDQTKLIHNGENNIDCTEITNCGDIAEPKSILSKVRETNMKKSKRTKRPSEKPTDIKDPIRKRCVESDFISLIKQRLEEKEINYINEKNNSEKLE